MGGSTVHVDSVLLNGRWTMRASQPSDRGGRVLVCSHVEIIASTLMKCSQALDARSDAHDGDISR